MKNDERGMTLLTVEVSCSLLILGYPVHWDPEDLGFDIHVLLVSRELRGNLGTGPTQSGKHPLP